MPQMSPMYWLILMLFFIIIYLFLMMKIYSFMIYMKSMKLINLKKKYNFILKW